MAFLFLRFWYWLVAIFVVGLATALLTREAERRRNVAPWLVWAGLAFGLGLLAAELHVLLGRAGLWLETGLAAFAAFILGACAGVFSRQGDLREHKAWALGLLAAIPLWVGANLAEIPGFENDLKRSVDAALQQKSISSPDFAVLGRDVRIPADVPDRAALADTIKKVEGVRLVAGVEQGLQESAPVETAAKSGPSGPENAPLPTAKREPEAPTDAKEERAEKQAPDEAAAAKPVLSPEEKIKAAQALLKALPPTGPLDAATCQAALEATQTVEKIEFRLAGSSIRRRAALVLNQIAALLQRCPDSKVEIAVHTDNIGRDADNQALSQRRADAVVSYLVRMGVAPSRVSGVGYGAQKPIASNDDENGRAQNRRVEIILK